MANKSTWQRQAFFPEQPPEGLTEDTRKEAMALLDTQAKNRANRFSRIKRKFGCRVRVIRRGAVTLVMWHAPYPRKDRTP